MSPENYPEGDRVGRKLETIRRRRGLVLLRRPLAAAYPEGTLLKKEKCRRGRKTILIRMYVLLLRTIG